MGQAWRGRTGSHGPGPGACTQAHRNTQLMLSGILAQTGLHGTQKTWRSLTHSPACRRPVIGRPLGNMAPRSRPGLEFSLSWRLSHGPKDLTGPPLSTTLRPAVEDHDRARPMAVQRRFWAPCSPGLFLVIKSVLQPYSLNCCPRGSRPCPVSWSHCNPSQGPTFHLMFPSSEPQRLLPQSYERKTLKPEDGGFSRLLWKDIQGKGGTARKEGVPRVDGKDRSRKCICSVHYIRCA